MTYRIIVLLALACLGSSAAHANQDLLASAKTLYESASYEAALTELSAIDGGQDLDVIDTYRALCLVALGRTRDAERALERIATRTPLLMLTEAEYSPRIVAMFREVRRRSLPAIAQKVYAEARSHFDAKNYQDASHAFKQVLQLIGDVEPADQTPVLTDVKQLAEGFLTLADEKLTPRSVEAPPAPVAPVPAAPAIYTILDAGVTPPVVREQRMPAWTFNEALRQRKFSGQLEVIVNETGAVQSATLAQSIWPLYDAALLQAAKLWRYEPAMKDGKPVKFRRLLAINIEPNASVAR